MARLCLRRCFGWSILGLLLAASPAFAHRVHVSAHALGTKIFGEVEFSGDVAVKNAKVIAYGPAGEKIGETTTDEQGKFSLEARFRCDHRLLVDTGDGHGAEYTVVAAQLSTSLPPRSGLDTILSQIIELQRRLDQYERKIRWRDVLGGIGYIMGVAGIAFYFLGVRRKQSQSTD